MIHVENVLLDRKCLLTFLNSTYIFRSGGNEDCPNNVSHQLQCCAVPEYYYGHCESFGTDYGIPNSCLDHGNLILEGI